MPDIKRVLPPLVAAVAVVGALALVHPRASAEDAETASSGVSFTSTELPGAMTNQRVRPVQPDLLEIDAWISAVGASVGSLDLRGQGTDGDACATDPRDDELRVFSVPGSSGKPFTTFTLTPPSIGRDASVAPIGCVPADVDSDGAVDITAYYWGRSPVIFLNDGSDGPPTADQFTAIELDAAVPIWNTTALNVADIDGDGIKDILVGNYFPDGARVLDVEAEDDNRMQMQRGMGAARNAGENRIFLGKGDDADGIPTFADASDAFPVRSAQAWTLALGLQDLTSDGLPEIYVSNDFGPDQMLLNKSTPGNVVLEEVTGDRTMVSPKSTVMGNDSFKGMGVTFAWEENKTDLPNILVSNITSPWALQEQNMFYVPNGTGDDLVEGRWPYDEKAVEKGTNQSGWSWDIKPIDVTNSGKDSFVQATGMVRGTRNVWPRLQEVAMGNDQILENPEVWLNVKEGDDLSGDEPARMWAPVGDRFVDIGKEIGFSGDDLTRGFSIADVNADGRMDILVAGQWGPSRVFINQSESERPVADIRVVTQTENGVTPVIGAQVKLDGDGYSRIAQLYPANGHSGVSGNSLHFAVPDNSAGDLTATVRWMKDGKVREQEFPVDATTQGQITLEVTR